MSVITMTRDNFTALVSAIADEQEIRSLVKAAQAVPAIDDTEDTAQTKELIETVQLLTQLATLQLSE